MLSRFKFEIGGLFQEIYDERLPETLFMSETTTFADLQSAGLQAIIPIVNKLRQYGHSDENIRGRVFAFCEDELDLNSVQFDFSDVPVTFDIYKESIDMKFDVVVGNPPYQENGRKDQANKLWPKMIVKGFELVKNEGYLTMITPNGWMNSTTSDIGKGKSGIKIYKDIFKKNNLTFVNIDSEVIKNKYFNGVGSTFAVFVVQKAKYQGNTEVFKYGEESFVFDISEVEDLPKNIDTHTLSILDKFNKHQVRFDFTDQNHNLNGTEVALIDDTHTFPLFHTHKNGGTLWYGSEESKHFGKHNVVITLSGKYEAVYTNFGFSNMCVGVTFESEEVCNNVLSFLNSKLYKFFIDMNKFSGFNPRQAVLSLPKLDVEKAWTNDEIYDFFGLTSKEKEYIDEYSL
jgi:site-specific DNA-methyltransferase (adenine-specific)